MSIQNQSASRQMKTNQSLTAALESETGSFLCTYQVSSFARDLLLTIKTEKPLAEFHYVRRDTFTIDDARSAINRAAGKRSTVAPLVIVLDAIVFTIEAQNSLLKLAEETPQGVFLFLCAPVGSPLVQTLLSRLLPVLDNAVTASSEADSVADETTVQSRVAEKVLEEENQSWIAGDFKDRQKLTKKILDNEEPRRQILGLLDRVTAMTNQNTESAAVRSRRNALALRSVVFNQSASLKAVLESAAVLIQSRFI